MAFGTNPYVRLNRRLEQVKDFTLPVCRSVRLFGPEVDVVATPEFQRLAGINQLGTTYVVYRGAVHKRFEHSLGALHYAELMIQAIKGNPRTPYDVPVEAWILARLGALLHDLPHVAFGHTLEDEFHLLKRHDENDFRWEVLLEKSRIASILRRDIGDHLFDQLVKSLRAKTDKAFADLDYPFVGDIIGNTVCADLLDYVQRDCFHCGLPVAVGQWILDYLSVTQPGEGADLDERRLVLNLGKRGMPRPDVESEVVKLLTFRYELAERVYLHHAKNAASVMIGRAVQEAGYAVGEKGPQQQDQNFHYLSDDLLLHALRDPTIARAVGMVPIPGHIGNPFLASDLAERVIRRDLYKIAYLAVWDDLPNRVRNLSRDYGATPRRRQQLEDDLAADAGIPPGTVLVHIPREKMMEKAADVRVRTDDDEILKLQEWDQRHSQRIHALNNAHERLWRVLVYIHPEFAGAERVLRAAAHERFRAVSRVKEAKPAPYKRVLAEELAEEWAIGADEVALAEHAAFSIGGGRNAAEAGILAAIQQHRNDERLPDLKRKRRGGKR